MDIGLIFPDYLASWYERTQLSIFRPLLDWGRHIEDVFQANPENTSPRYGWNFRFGEENEIKQAAGKIL